MTSEPFDRVLRSSPSTSLASSEHQDRLMSDDEWIVSGVDDQALAVECVRSETDAAERVKMRCSIVYSETYKVPQFLFEAYKPDGSSLSLEELLRTDIFLTPAPDAYPFTTLHPSGNDSDPVQLPFLTTVAHPVSGRPVWSIHPCNTEAVLQELVGEGTPRDGQVIESFFVMVAGLVNL